LQRIALLDTTGQDLRNQTGRLVDALKRPGVRGRWGELQLRRVIELAGMLEHCDFEQQQMINSTDDSDRRMRPDVIVRLPGGKHVVIDAKAPLDAYLKALDAPTRRQAGASRRSRQAVRTHLSQLASKGYAAHVHQPGLRRHVPAGGDVLQRGAGAGCVAHRFGGAGRHPREPDDAHRPVAGGGVRLAAAIRGRERAQDRRAGAQPVESVRVLGGHFDSLGTRLKSALEAYMAPSDPRGQRPREGAQAQGSFP
jgi:DNA recombination protein RmuC